MALGGLAVAFIVADTLLRRLILPLALLSGKEIGLCFTACALNPKLLMLLLFSPSCKFIKYCLCGLCLECISFIVLCLVHDA